MIPENITPEVTLKNHPPENLRCRLLDPSSPGIQFSTALGYNGMIMYTENEAK
jgi:hypothetical protein